MHEELEAELIALHMKPIHEEVERTKLVIAHTQVAMENSYKWCKRGLMYAFFSATVLELGFYFEIVTTHRAGAGAALAGAFVLPAGYHYWHYVALGRRLKTATLGLQLILLELKKETPYQAK